MYGDIFLYVQNTGEEKGENQRKKLFKNAFFVRAHTRHVGRTAGQKGTSLLLCRDRATGTERITRTRVREREKE